MPSDGSHITFPSFSFGSPMCPTCRLTGQAETATFVPSKTPHPSCSEGPSKTSLLQQKKNIFKFPLAIYSWPRCALFDPPPVLSSNINHSPSSHPECIYEK